MRLLIGFLLLLAGIVSIFRLSKTIAMFAA